MNDVLTNVRQLLLTFETITDEVDQRIRPHHADSSDGSDDTIILDLPDADQFNLLSGEAIVNGDLIIRTRSTSKARASVIGGLVHDALRDFSGVAGDGVLIHADREEFSEYDVDDDDDDDDTFFETESLFSIWFQQ